MLFCRYFVSCRGVVQLGGLMLGSPSIVPLRSREDKKYQRWELTHTYKIVILYIDPAAVAGGRAMV